MKEILTEWRQYLIEQEDGVNPKSKYTPGPSQYKPWWVDNRALPTEKQARAAFKDINGNVIKKGDFLLMFKQDAGLNAMLQKCRKNMCKVYQVDEINITKGWDPDGSGEVVGYHPSIYLKGYGGWRDLAYYFKKGYLFLKIKKKLSVGKNIANPTTDVAETKRDDLLFTGEIAPDGTVVKSGPKEWQALIQRRQRDRLRGVVTTKKILPPAVVKILKKIGKKPGIESLNIKEYLTLLYQNVPGGIKKVEQVSRQYGGNPRTQGKLAIHTAPVAKAKRDFKNLRPPKDFNPFQKLSYYARAAAKSIGKDAREYSNILTQIFGAKHYPGGGGGLYKPDLQTVSLGKGASLSTKRHEIAHHINPPPGHKTPLGKFNPFGIERPKDKNKYKQDEFYHDARLSEMQAEQLSVIKHYWASKGKLATNPKEADQQIQQFLKTFNQEKGLIYNLLRTKKFRRQILRFYLQTVYAAPKGTGRMLAAASQALNKNTAIAEIKNKKKK